MDFRKQIFLGGKGSIKASTLGTEDTFLRIHEVCEEEPR